MDVETSIDLTAEEAQELSGILGCTEADLADELAKYAKAALREYAEMFLGKRVFNRGGDLKEYRLLLLIEHAFNNRIPDEAKVCQLFQTTTHGSRALLRSTMSKYQYQLHGAVRESVRQVLVEAQQHEDGEDYEVIINNTNMVEVLNQTLANRDGTQRRVRKQKDSVSTYEIAPASYEILREEFGVRR